MWKTADTYVTEGQTTAKTQPTNDDSPLFQQFCYKDAPAVIPKTPSEKIT